MSRNLRRNLLRKKSSQKLLQLCVCVINLGYEIFGELESCKRVCKISVSRVMHWLWTLDFLRVLFYSQQFLDRTSKKGSSEPRMASMSQLRPLPIFYSRTLRKSYVQTTHAPSRPIFCRHFIALLC